MEQFPNSNSENINREPADAGEDKPLSFSEHMAKKQNYEQAFKEAQDNGTLPEGVRDAQDYQEYLEENQAREAEQDKANKEAENNFNKRIEKAVNVIDEIKNPDDKDLATSILGWFSAEHRREEGEYGLDKISRYQQADESEPFLDFLKREKAIDGLDGYYDGFDELYDAYNTKEKFWRDANLLTWGEKIQKEMNSSKNNSNKKFKIGRYSDINEDGYRTQLYGYYFDRRVEPDKQIDAATIRLLAKTKIPSGISDIEADGDMELKEDLPKEIRHELAALRSIQYCGCNVKEYIFDVLERTIDGDLPEDELVGRMKTCFKLQKQLNALLFSYESYSEGLSDGQAILDNFKNNLGA